MSLPYSRPREARSYVTPVTLEPPALQVHGTGVDTTVMSYLRDARRLAEVRSLAILDTPPEAEYDNLVAIAAAVCRSPVAAVNFVDDERHFTKAVVGMPEAEGGSISNDVSFCAATVASADGVLIIPDTRAESRWSDHPLVTGGPEAGFYAGVSIVSRGQRVGVLCAFGPQAREIGDQERSALTALARQAATHLELRRQNARLRELALTDPLTGLANRTLLFERLQDALAQHGRSGRGVGVLYCDVDDFKDVNDRCGHEAGDRMLRGVAEHLLAVARDTDTVARIAGDEFVLIRPGATEQSDMDAVSARITADMALSNASPSLSMGAAVARDGDSPADLLRRADTAMYAAKATLRRRRTDEGHPVEAHRSALRLSRSAPVIAPS